MTPLVTSLGNVVGVFTRVVLGQETGSGFLPCRDKRRAREDLGKKTSEVFIISHMVFTLRREKGKIKKTCQNMQMSQEVLQMSYQGVLYPPRKSIRRQN